VQIALALVLTIVSACALDLGYLLQHAVAARLPALSLRRPIASVRSLLLEPRWLIGSGILSSHECASNTDRVKRFMSSRSGTAGGVSADAFSRRTPHLGLIMRVFADSRAWQCHNP
jgi:hypothetical protein